MGARVDRQPQLTERKRAPTAVTDEAAQVRRAPQMKKGRPRRPFFHSNPSTHAAACGGLTVSRGRPTSRASTTIATSVATYTAIWIPAGRAV